MKTGRNKVKQVKKGRESGRERIKHETNEKINNRV
jgi:hypothetical protein